MNKNLPPKMPEDATALPIYLALNGIPRTGALDPTAIYFYRDSQGTWYPTKGDLLYEIDDLCVQIHDALAANIFDGIDNYHSCLGRIPQYACLAGLNSEANLGKEQFERLVAQSAGDAMLNKALYLYDCRKLVSSIQECSKEVVQLQGEFYRILNLES